MQVAMKKENSLLVDFCTNGEVAIDTREALVYFNNGRWTCFRRDKYLMRASSSAVCTIGCR